MKVSILGTSWKITMLSAEAFERRFGEYLAGITLPPSNQIVLCEDELDIRVVRHELWHAAFASLCLSSTTVSKNQQEEILCELFAQHAPVLLKLSSKIYKEMKKNP